MDAVLLHMAQSRGIDEAKSAARRGTAKAIDAKRNVKFVEDRLDRLTLVNMAMWSLLKDKTGVTEEDLINRMVEIDISDGRADGKVTPGVRKCGKCGRTLAAKHRKCLYCGAADLRTTAFEATL
jgi:ribosomal protein S27AE